MSDLATEICGVKFASCIINAAGSRDHTMENLHEIGPSQAGGIVIKTVTKDPRPGNVEPRTYWYDDGGVNAMGIPSLGYEVCVTEVPKLKQYSKPIIVSLSAMQPSELPAMITGFIEAGVDLIEVDVSCSNIEGQGVIAYEPELLREVLQVARDASSIPIAPKLPPYLHKERVAQVAQVIEDTGMDFVVSGNTLGQGLVIDKHSQRKVIAANDGLGGISGPTIKPFALANVYSLNKLLKGAKPIIGVGGVATGRDAFEHLLAGASAVGTATTFIKEGPRVFERLNQELTAELEKERYDSPAAARGKLQELPPVSENR